MLNYSSKCIICGNTKFKKNHNRKEYEYCTICQTNIKKDLKAKNANIFNIYGDVDMFAMEKLLNNDKSHYKNFFNEMGKQKLFNVIFEGIKFNSIYAFGGGLPKLESFINHDKLTIYDACAGGYTKHIDNFNKIYEYTKEIKYRQYYYDVKSSFYDDVLSKIPEEPNILITFVHFLEHLVPELFDQIFKDLFKFSNNNNNSSSSKLFMIYQPNVSLARKNNWCHWWPDHLTLVPLDSYVTYLNNIGFQTIFNESYSDDMVIIFR